MRIGLITPRPDHPLLAGAVERLVPRHEVEWVDPERGGGVPGPDVPGLHAAGPKVPAPQGRLADVYLLKARTPRALALARSLEDRGAPVVNSAAATELCQDRTAMAELAWAAGLPFAATRPVGRLDLLGGPDGGLPSGLRYPVVVKSRHSRRDDLVARVDGAEKLRALVRAWPGEQVVVQPFTANSGWDRKLWVIGGEVFAALRRSELSHGADRPTLPLDLGELPPGWLDLVRRTGSAFGLDVYGVDLLDAGDGAPVIVDVNAFPGARLQPGAPEALAALALHRATTPAPAPALPAAR